MPSCNFKKKKPFKFKKIFGYLWKERLKTKGKRKVNNSGKNKTKIRRFCIGHDMFLFDGTEQVTKNCCKQNSCQQENGRYNTVILFSQIFICMKTILKHL